MAQLLQSDGNLRFSDFVLDLRTRELRKHGIRVRLQEQPFLILQALLERPGELVTREELQKRIWPCDTFVDFDKGLNNAIRRLRDVFSDSAEAPRYIETLPRQGYRFIAAITPAQICEEVHPVIQVATEGSTDEARPRPRSRAGVLILIPVGVALTLLAAAIIFKGGLRDRLLGRTAQTRIQSLAVLPLTNLSNDPNQEYFAKGMTDALITDLAQIGSLKIISGTSSRKYEKSDKTLPEIARELNVDGIIEGTVQRSGARVRITAQLIHGPSDKHLWANSYERDARDVLSMESEIAGAIASQIKARLTPEQEARLAGPRPVNLKAFEAYLQGKYHLTLVNDATFQNGQQKTEQSEVGTARDFFEKAISEDPNFAPAYVGLSETERGPEMQKQALEKALKIDPALAEAHVALGTVEFYGFLHWAAAESEFKRAIELNPNLAPAHDGYRDYLDTMGRFEEGMREYLRTQELDPGHVSMMPNPFFTRRLFDKAIEMDRNDVERHAFGFIPHFNLAHDYEAKGMHDESVKEWEITMRMLGYEDIANAMDQAFRVGGYKRALRELVRGMELGRARGENIPTWVLAGVYSYLGDRDHAFTWLEKERDSGLLSLKIGPAWDNLRSDPRFQDLVRRLNFPQ